MAYIRNLPITLKNPDGEELHLFESGDEFSNYIHDEYDNKIMQGADGYYYLAQQEGDNIFPSNIRYSKDIKEKIFEVQETEEQYKRRAERMYGDPELKKDTGVEGFTKNFLHSIGFSPLSGSMHLGILNNIVIYIRFADDDNNWLQNRGFYNNRWNADSSSVKDYFRKVSYNKIDVISHGYPISPDNLNLSYQDIYPRSYFQPYSTSNPNGYTSAQRTEREHALLKRAIEAVRHEIPTDLVIDSTNNGRVDAVSFIVKGNATGWGSILWGHRWALYSYNVTINGKRVWDFTFQPENQATVQILAHEMFHVFGAPDLYRYSGSGIDPVGSWDLMNSGHGHMGAHMKHKYADAKWVENIPIITQSGRYRINPLTSPTNNVYRINSPNSTQEYFIVEFRKKIGTDEYEARIPNTGLLVYRINVNINDGNRNGPPDEVYIYRPNGTLTTNGLLNNANYTNKAGRTSITDTTIPKAFLMDNSNGGLHITNITEFDNYMEFDVFIEGTTPIEDKTVILGTNPIDIGSVEGGGTFSSGSWIRIKALI